MTDSNNRKLIISTWYDAMSNEQKRDAFVNIVFDCEEDALVSIRKTLKKIYGIKIVEQEEE